MQQSTHSPLRRARTVLYSWYRRSPLKPLVNQIVHRREFQAYTIGISRSGNSTLGRMFGRHYRVDDEPELTPLSDMIFARARNAVSRAEVACFLRKRDKRLWLELEANYLNFYFVDVLVEEFEEARFIVPVRDCYSWLNAQLHQEISLPLGRRWRRLLALHFQQDGQIHRREERFLAERGLYTLDGYLSYWATHYTGVLATIPEERLLVLPTSALARSAGEIARFLGIPEHTLDTSEIPSHEEAKHNLLLEIDRTFLEEKIGQHCRDIMESYFPHIQRLEDALPC